MDETEEAAKVGVLGEEIPEELSGAGIGVEGVAIGDWLNPDRVVAAGNPVWLILVHLSGSEVFYQFLLLKYDILLF